MKRLLAILLILLAASVASAKDLYVDSGHGSCSNSTTYAANDADHPWCHLLRATWGRSDLDRSSACTDTEAADAGDTVHVAGGPYSGAGTDNSGEPLFRLCNDGTSGSRITIEAASQVELRLSSSLGPVIGANANGGAYTTWRNFKIDNAEAAPRQDSASATVFNTDGVNFDQLELIGIEAPAWSNNYSGIRLENGRYFNITNCDISNFTEIGYDATGITVYHAYDVIIEHNEFHDNGFGINIKALFEDGGGTLDGDEGYEFIVRYNYFYDNVKTEVLAFGVLGPGVKTYVYQNLFFATNSEQANNRAMGFQGYLEGYPSYVYFVNNTVYGDYDYGGVSLYAAANHGSNLVQNNIVYSTGTVGTNYYVFGIDVTAAGAIDEDKVDFEYNLAYCDAVAFYDGESYPWDTDSDSWTEGTDNVKTSYLDDLGSIWGSDPLFANAGSDYRLCTASGVPVVGCSGASPAINAGIDILDLDGDESTTDPITMGAYITGNETIGIEGGSGYSVSYGVAITGGSIQ